MLHKLFQVLFRVAVVALIAITGAALHLSSRNNQWAELLVWRTEGPTNYDRDYFRIETDRGEAVFELLIRENLPDRAFKGDIEFRYYLRPSSGPPAPTQDMVSLENLDFEPVNWSGPRDLRSVLLERFTHGVIHRTYHARCRWVHVALVSGASLLILLTAKLLRRRHRPGACKRCGYDIRESPIRCPECGTSTLAPPRHRHIVNT